MRKALVVGIDDYPHSPLKGCVNDANTIAGLLQLHGDGTDTTHGTPNFAVKLLTSPGTPVSRSVLRAGIEQLFAGDPDVALLYFAGHGLVKSTGGYLATIDTRRHDEGVSMDEVLSLANASDARNKVVILDCCHAGAMGEPNFGGGSAAVLSNGLSVLTACLKEESAMEARYAGVFSSLLADALRGGAADLRGNVTPGALYAYVDAAMGAWDQRPMFKTNVSALCSLRRVPPRVPLEVLRKLTQYFPSPGDDHPLSPEHEDTHPGHDPAKVAAFKDLQKCQSVGLVVPVGAEYMYYAAMESKACRLTAMGHQYWRLAKEGKLWGRG